MNIILVCFLTTFFYTIGVNSNCPQYLDLTWSFNNDTIYWGKSMSFRYTEKREGIRNDGDWYSMYNFAAGEHGGTHFDAPYHFYEQGWKVGEVPFERFISHGALVDLTDHIKSPKENFEVQPKHLRDWERKNGPFEDDTILLFRFNRSQYWHDKDTFLGIDAQGTYNFPGISEAAARWIAESGKFLGVGVDTASIDPGNSKTFQAHKILARAQFFNIENAKLLEKLPARGFKLFVLPMKTEGGTGAPLRLVAELKCTKN